MGCAHIGVLEVLSENGIPMDIIVGSSAGAAIGAFYAAGCMRDFKKLISNLSLWESLNFYADPVFPTSGLLAGKRARTFIHDLVGDIHIEDLALKYTAVTTDLLTGETVPIDSGELTDAVLASISMPGIFKPVVHMDRLLTDGGVSDPLPLDILKSIGPDITIACNLHSKMPARLNNSQRRSVINAQQSSAKDEDIPSWMIDRLMKVIQAQNMFEGIKPLANNIVKKINKSYSGTAKDIDLASTIHERLSQSKDKINSLINKSFNRQERIRALNIIEIMVIATNIQQYQKNRLMLLYEQPDVLIEPDVGDIGSLEFTKGSSTIEEGRSKAFEALPKIERLLNKKR